MSNGQPCDVIVRLSPLYQELSLGEYRGPPELEASRSRYTDAQDRFVMFTSTGLEAIPRRVAGLPEREWRAPFYEVGES